MNFLNLKAVLNLNGSGFALGLKRAESQSKQFAKEIKGEFAKAFGTAAVVAYSKKLVDMAGQITELSDRTGVSTKALQEWAYAARQSGSNIETVAKYLEHLALAKEKALGGDSDSLAAFGKLGVSRDDLASKPLEDVAAQIGSAVGNGNIQDLITSLREIGGKSAGELVPAMADFAQLSKEATIVSDQNLESLASMADTLTGMADTLSAELLPYMSKFGELADGALTVISTGLRTLWAGLKSLWEDQTFEQTGAKMSAAFDKGVEGWERRREGVKKRAEARKAITGQISGGGDVLHDATVEEAKKVVERHASGGMNRPSLTSWQTAGAGIRFTPEMQKTENYLQAIAKNTLETARGLTEKKPQSFEGLGGGFS